MSRIELDQDGFFLQMAKERREASRNRLVLRGDRIRIRKFAKRKASRTIAYAVTELYVENGRYFRDPDERTVTVSRWGAPIFILYLTSDRVTDATFVIGLGPRRLASAVRSLQRTVLRPWVALGLEGFRRQRRVLNKSERGYGHIFSAVGSAPR